MTSAAVAADVKAARAEIDRCTANRIRFNLRDFLRKHGSARADSVARRFRHTYGMTTLAMCASLRKGDVPPGQDPRVSTSVCRAEALRNHIDECVERGVAVRKGAFADFIKATGAKCDNAVRTAFARITKRSPRDYYFDKLVERASVIKAERPLIARGWLAVKLGVDDTMIDRVLARLSADQEKAA